MESRRGAVLEIGRERSWGELCHGEGIPDQDDGKSRVARQGMTTGGQRDRIDDASTELVKERWRGEEREREMAKEEKEKEEGRKEIHTKRVWGEGRVTKRSVMLLQYTQLHTTLYSHRW